MAGRPENYQETDPLRMFPSDFRLWDGYCSREDDPKVFTREEDRYYMPFEIIICSRDGFSWFFFDIYENAPLLSVDNVVERCHTALKSGNLVVINMPPNREGKLVEADVDHLMDISKGLGLSRG